MTAEQIHTWHEPLDQLPIIDHEPEWLTAQRKQALTHYQEVGLPGVRDEQWRYTNLRAIKSEPFTLSDSTQTGLSEDLIKQLGNADKPRLVFVDGHFSSSHSDISDLDEGVIFTSLAEILKNQPELVKQHLGGALPNDQHGFTALNTAFCQDGYVLILPKKIQLKSPLEVVFVASTSVAADPKLSYIRNIVIAESSSQGAIIERYIGSESSVYLNNSISEIIAGENSHIDHYRLIQESDDAFHIGGVFIEQASNAHVKNHNISLSGLVTRNDIITNLNAPGAHIEMNGLVMGNRRQHFDNHTQVNHIMPHCTSDEYYKTILDDQSRSVFRGRIIVAEDAQKTIADQQNNNLLLSSDAEADSLPQLEIYADDVKCSHGATVGQLDPKSMFYLQSRGINSESARALLTFAFANEVIDRIQIDSVREELTALMNDQLLATND